jgi:hypothetical protein
VLAQFAPLAAWLAECDERARELGAWMDRLREDEAERHRQALPATILGRIRAAGYDLTVDAKGHLLASPGAPLEQLGDGNGLEIYAQRRDEFVAILRTEAAAAKAEAKRLAPVVIA